LALPLIAANAGTDAFTSADTARAVWSSTGRSADATSAGSLRHGAAAGAAAATGVSTSSFYHYVLIR
jgi:hypothetical protein